PPAIVRLEPVMRVPRWVDIAHRAGNLPGGNLQDLDVHRGIEISLAARLNLRVAAAADERRQPADLQLAADDDQEVGPADSQDEARLRIDKVRILVPLGERRDGDAVAANFLRERSEVGC